MNRSNGLGFLFSLMAYLATACASGQFTTITIYETPTSYVRLEVDRTVKQGTEHSHPISLTPEQIAAVLSGVRIDEPIGLVRGDILQDSVPRIHPAFTEKEISFFAPLLAVALSKARPEEVVTFYETRYRSATSREVTSGGVFVRDDELHLILANYRSHTHYMADMGVAETHDDRMTPLESLNPQLGRLDFVPSSAKRQQQAGTLDKLFQWDHRELAVLFRQLPPHPLVQPSS